MVNAKVRFGDILPSYAAAFSASVIQGNTGVGGVRISGCQLTFPKTVTPTDGLRLQGEVLV